MPGPKEPLLWVADAVAGAVVAHRCGIPEYLHHLRARVELIQMGP